MILTWLGAASGELDEFIRGCGKYYLAATVASGRSGGCSLPATLHSTVFEVKLASPLVKRSCHDLHVLLILTRNWFFSPAESSDSAPDSKCCCSAK